MSTNNNPQLQALMRIESLREKASAALIRVQGLLDTALYDAANYLASGKSEARPMILSDDSIVDLTKVKNELAELVAYYSRQKEQFMAMIDAAKLTEKPAVDLQITMQQLRERTEQAARAKDAVIEPHGLDGGEDTQEAETKAINAPAAPALTEGGLPVPVEIKERNLRPPENNLQRLLGNNSPLLSFFAPSPWLPNGTGTVTVGTEGFQWYKRTDPMQRSEAERAALPSGFYFGDNYPKYALVRLESCIVLWSFELNVDASGILVYMAGISDMDPENPRWFKVTDLTASFTRRLVTELETATQKYKSAAQ